jgi:hypothetical protein
VRITQHGKSLRVDGSDDTKLLQTLAHMFRLDEDLSGFYTLVGDDGELFVVRAGRGSDAARPNLF